MPTYDYVCKTCGSSIEKDVKFEERNDIILCACGEPYVRCIGAPYLAKLSDSDSMQNAIHKRAVADNARIHREIATQMADGDFSALTRRREGEITPINSRIKKV